MIFLCYQSKNPPFNQKILIIPNEKFIMPRDNFVFFLLRYVYQKMEASMEIRTIQTMEAIGLQKCSN